MRVLLAPTLTLASAIKADITIEAEYGDSVCEGSRYTAAHHTGKWQGNPAPCCDTSIPLAAEGETILVSHLDLDTVGGAARAMGIFPEAKDFWSLAAFVDLNGPHKVGLWTVGNAGHPSLSEPGQVVRFNAACAAREEDAKSALEAYHAWAETRPRLPRDSVTDVTEEIRLGAATLHKILLLRDEQLLAAGESWAAKKEELKASSFLGVDGDVVIRKSPSFTNHLYDYEGGVGKAVVALNTKTGAITVSFENPPPANCVSAREIVQALWRDCVVERVLDFNTVVVWEGTSVLEAKAEIAARGGVLRMLAGGHPGISGSPRGRVMTERDLAEAARLVALTINRPGRLRVEESPLMPGLKRVFQDADGQYSLLELKVE